MKVILRANVEGVGNTGDLVDVANGYAQNFLMPKGLAMRATEGAATQAEAMQRTGGFMPERSLSIDPVVMANNAVKQHFIQGSSLSVLKSLNAKLGSQTQMA